MIKYYKWVKLPTKVELSKEFGIVDTSFRNTKPDKLLLYMLGLLKKKELGEELFSSLCDNTHLCPQQLSRSDSKSALLILGMMHKSEIDSKGV